MLDSLFFDNSKKTYTIWLYFYGVKYMKHFKSKSDLLAFVRNNPNRLLSNVIYDFDALPECDYEDDHIYTMAAHQDDSVVLKKKMAAIFCAVSVFWIASVIFFVFLFSPYGEMSSSDYIHFIKVVLFLPILIVFAYFIYFKVKKLF